MWTFTFATKLSYLLSIPSCERKFITLYRNHSLYISVQEITGEMDQENTKKSGRATRKLFFM